MAMPGMAVLISWPLAVRSGWLAWLGIPASLVVVMLTDGGLIYNTPDVELKLVLACTVMWCTIALRLVLLTRPWTPRRVPPPRTTTGPATASTATC